MSRFEFFDIECSHQLYPTNVYSKYNENSCSQLLYYLLSVISALKNTDYSRCINSVYIFSRSKRWPYVLLLLTDQSALLLLLISLRSMRSKCINVIYFLKSQGHGRWPYRFGA